MANRDTDFTGPIAGLYQRHLVPLLFQPWADLIAEQAAAMAPTQIVEMAAGTGVLTAALAARCPDAQITATDLNPAMLDFARGAIPGGTKVTFAPADACDLPFEDGRFDLACSQFGIMFYPDRVKAYAEAARVLRSGGTMIAAVWGSLVENRVSEALQQAMEATFPADPPRFLARTPFGYHDADIIVGEAKDGGFKQVSVERITLRHPRVPLVSAVEGLILGSPLRGEVEAHGPGATRLALDAANRALADLADGAGLIDATMTALLITAR